MSECLPYPKPHLVECKRGFVLISAHAIKQFTNRWPIRYNGEPLQYPIGKIIEFFCQSKVENFEKFVRITRMLRNDGRPARYYYRSGWRFVVDDSAVANNLGIVLIITIEIDSFGFERRRRARVGPTKLPRRFQKKPVKIRRISKKSRRKPVLKRRLDV